MITNLPTQESLNDVALRTYFRAWNDLVNIWIEFSSSLGENESMRSVLDQNASEWQQYVRASQSDLQSICSLLQQAIELALKARVCAVSPYLLLLDTGVKFSISSKQIDFAELRTLDAVDLPGAVNTLTDNPVSDEFVTSYTRLRSLRNKITHLGEASVSLEPDEVFRQAVLLYINMWPDRRWLSDRLRFASQTRRAWLHDGKYTSVHMEVLQEWPVDIELLTNREFKKLFGHDRSKRRYLCHRCVYEGDTRYAGLEKPGCGTAYLDAIGTAVTCIMCGETSSVDRRKCPSCDGNVVGANGDDWVGHCHTCGTNVEEDTAS